MASKVGALVRNFLQTDGDALYLVPGEKIFIARGTARTVAGREAVSEESFRAVVDELVPGVSAETLCEKRNRLPYVAGAGLPPVEIHFATIGGVSAMMIVRSGQGPGGEVPSPQAPARQAPAVAEPPGPRMDPVPKQAPPALGGAVEALVAIAREKGASDVYVASAERPLLRIHGSLVPVGAEPLPGGEVDAFLSRRLPARAAKTLSGIGSARFVLESGDAGRVLVRASRDRNGVSLSARILPEEAPQLEELGLPEAVLRLAGPTPGLLLVAGPPGSGRTTLLAALAANASRGRGERVLTVEDPVEIVIAAGRGSVSQRETGADVPSVRAGLKAALSNDSDVVLAGSIPDGATAALVVELAASGRLVLAPAPAASLALALQWLDSMLPEGRRPELRALLAQSFRGGVALALCRGRKGGRFVAAESLQHGSLVSDLILGGRVATLPDHLRDSPGYAPLNESLASLVGAGLVEPHEALLRSLDRPALVAQLRDAGGGLPPEPPAGAQGG
jgi:twitching motility protein PilT